VQKVFVQSLKDPTKRYEVVKFDEDTKTATLRGQYAEFQIRPFTKKSLADKGYALDVQGE
jgi:hypothetical protein